MFGFFTLGPLRILASQRSIAFLRDRKRSLEDENTLKRVEVFKALVGQLEPPFQAYDHEGKILDMICSIGSFGVIKFLVEKGLWKYDPNLNVPEIIQDYNPLDALCRQGRLDVVKYLVDERKSIDIYDIYDKGYYAACAWGHLKLAKYISKRVEDVQDKSTDIASDVSSSSADMLRFLIPQGVEVLIFESQCFRIACRANYLPSIKLLIFYEGDTLLEEDVLKKLNSKNKDFLSLSSAVKLRIAGKFVRTLHIRDLLKAP